MPRTSKKTSETETKTKKSAKTGSLKSLKAKPKTVSDTSFLETGSTQSSTDKVRNGLTTLLNSFQFNKRTYFIIILLGLLLLAFYKKDWLVAATVNGAPISNFEVLGRLNQQYRSQVLNQMVNERIITDEAKKNNVTVSNEEVDNKISQLEANVGGTEALDGLLVQQGQTRSSLRDQLRIQIMIEKLYAQDATSSAEEINAFMEENKDQLQATTSAEQVKEAEEILTQQKLAKVFNQKFQELKEKAQVKIF